MTDQNPYDAYLESKILSASPVELIRILYGAALDSVREARNCLSAGRIAPRSRAITRAIAILTELGCSLDHGKGGELSRTLAELYDYMERRLIVANQEQSDTPLAEVLGLIENLSDAWREVAAPAGDTSANPKSFMPKATPAYTGQSWSL
jgi:flagellar protein FliS